MTTSLGALVRRHRLAHLVPGRRMTNGPASWREHIPLSMNALARRTGVDPAYVHRIEQGRHGTPSADVVVRLAEALHLDELETARLLVCAGYWPFPDLDDDSTDLALGILFAIGNGDYRPLAPEAVGASTLERAP